MDVDHKIRLVREATGRLLMTVRSLTEPELNAPSLCSGWTRGHVLAHVALNADSLVNLLTWACTGIETPQYSSSEARDGDIEAAAGRSVGEHLATLRDSAERFEHAARELPLERWSFTVRGIGGDAQPASNYLIARRREVEVHHADLACDYGSEHWPEDFVIEELAHAAAKLSRRAGAPFEIDATDLRVRHTIGEGPPQGSVTGRGHQLLAWLYGRSTGTDLKTTSDTLPQLPPWG